MIKRAPFVSVLTPIYNGETYLAECIESVLAQTYKNWDYTIIDNCSTDKSFEIAQRYAARDSRIRIVQNREHLTALGNHNVALSHISSASKYCKIVFGDDWIFPECLERMVTVSEKHPSVGIVGSYCLWGNELATSVGWTGLPYPSELVSGREICRKRFLQGLDVFGSATSVLLRADLVRDRNPSFYNEENIHADSEACLALLKTCDFGFVHQILTFSRIRSQSISNFSSDYNTYLPGRLHELVTYGRDYLTEEELGACLSKQVSDYYRFLGKSVLIGRERNFWAYHERELTKTGVGFKWHAVARGAMLEVGTAALNPKDSLARLLKRTGFGRVFGTTNHAQENYEED